MPSPTPRRAAQRWRHVNQALVDFYAPGLANDSFVGRAFALTSRLLPFDLNSHGVIDHASGVLTAQFDRELPGLAQAFSAFGRQMGKYAPFRFDPRVNGGRPFSARDFYSQRELNDLDIFQEVYRPMRFVDHCFMHVPAATGSTLFVGFLRGGRPFDAAEKALLTAIQPHLANGRALASAVSAARELPLSPTLFARAGFTARQSEVLFWLTQGKGTVDIAQLMRMRSDSVRRHLQAIYDKLGVDHRAAAVMRAVEIARGLNQERSGQKGQIELRARIRST